jgi:hypothetical protein
MTIEVRQLLIKSQVTQHLDEPAQRERQQAWPAEQLRAEILAECKAWLAQQLQAQRER